MSTHSPLVVAVVAGPHAGRRFRLEGNASVGRAQHCSIVFDDPNLSREHFEFVVEESVWYAQDSGSRNGTYLNGVVVKRSALRDGDQIRAGDVVIQIEQAARPTDPSVEARVGDAAQAATITVAARRLPTPIFTTIEPTLPAADPAPEPGTLAAALCGRLSPDRAVHLYAIVDGAQAFDLAFAGRLMGHAMYTLFSGDLALVAAQSGPCLLALEERSGFLRRWVQAIGTHAGILFEAEATPDELGPHLRHIFVATDEEGQEYFFRFYDPRVLRTFLPTCRPEELREFFGPVRRWIVERADASGYSMFANDGGVLVTEEIASSAGAGQAR